MAFRPFVETRLQDVRVVFLNKEPSIEMMAKPDGLAMSDSGPWQSDLSKVPRQSRYILRALMKDPVSKSLKHPRHMSLRHWARQGVFLWNICPFSSEGRPAYFAGYGFEELTEEILLTIKRVNPACLFVIPDSLPPRWNTLLQNAEVMNIPGIPAYAEQNLKAFENFQIFTKINRYFRAIGEPEIDWSIK